MRGAADVHVHVGGVGNAGRRDAAKLRAKKLSRILPLRTLELGGPESRQIQAEALPPRFVVRACSWQRHPGEPGRWEEDGPGSGKGKQRRVGRVAWCFCAVSLPGTVGV